MAAPSSSSRSTKNSNKKEKNAFAQHTVADSALQAPAASSNGQQQQHTTSKHGLTVVGRVAVFLLFPTAVGLLGLYVAWVESRRKKDKQLSLDRDFVLPFLLALAFVFVIGLQTGGFRTGKAEPLIAWPKVKRVKKVVVVKKPKGERIKEE